MKRTTIEIVAGLGVLGVVGLLYHQVSRLESRTEEVQSLRGLVEQSTTARAEPDEDVDAVRRELVRLVDDRLGDIERRLASATENVREASFLKQELEAARKEAETLKADVSRDVSQTREMVRTYYDELRAREARAEQSEARYREEVERLAGRVMPDTTALTQDLLLPTVQLNGTDTVGSGTLVRSDRDNRTGKTVNYVLTAFHVVRNILADTPRTRTEGIPVTVFAPDGRVDVPGFLVASEKDLDIALIELRTERTFPNVAHVMPRSQAERIEVWDDIYAIGCPLGNDPIPTSGAISSTRNVLNGTNYWMISAPTYYGNSGGGIYLAESRSLIGVFSKIYTHGRGNPVVVPHMGLCVPITAVYDWLDREKLSQVIPQDGTVHSPRAIDDDFGLATPAK